MADACSRGRFSKLYALCARLGVHPKRLDVPPDVAAFHASLAPDHGVFNFDLYSRSSVTSRCIQGPPAA
eukprot:4698901-Pleurochrysis_carterae.AAC.2